MKDHINFTSKQEIQKSTKFRNTQTFSIHILVQIMQEIFLTGYISHKQLNSSMELSLTGAPKYNMRPQDAVPHQNWMRKFFK